MYSTNINPDLFSWQTSFLAGLTVGLCEGTALSLCNLACCFSPPPYNADHTSCYFTGLRCSILKQGILREVPTQMLLPSGSLS